MQWSRISRRYAGDPPVNARVPVETGTAGFKSEQGVRSALPRESRLRVELGLSRVSPFVQ
jgi:hypothetical protein